MLSGFSLLVCFVLLVVLMIVAIAKFKWHPFLAIMGASLLLALFSLPLTEIPASIGNGFSGTFTSLGIVIILGTMIGMILEKTGAALSMADSVIRVMPLKGWLSCWKYCANGKKAIPLLWKNIFPELFSVRKKCSTSAGIRNRAAYTISGIFWINPYSKMSVC